MATLRRSHDCRTNLENRVSDGPARSARMVGMAESLSSSESARQLLKRPWYWLYMSTWVLLLPMVAALVLLMAPGVPAGYLTSEGYAIHFSRSYPQTDLGSWYHGWPWQFLKRDANRPALVALRDPAWLNASAWWGNDEVREWDFAALSSDIVVAIVITLGVAACLEWRRRRHSWFLQFSIVELGCAIGAVAVFLALWCSPVSEWQDELEAIAATHASDHDFRGNYLGPQWLRRIIGKDLTRRCERVQYVSLDRYDFQDASNRITAFKHLVCVDINNCSGVKVLVEWINCLPAFEDLYVKTDGADDEELDALFRTGKVTHLEIRSPTITDASFANVLVSKGLKHVEVRDASISDQSLIQVSKLPHLSGVAFENGGTAMQSVAISDAGIAHLSNARHLFRAGFSGTRITDDGIRSLAPCKELLQLYLRETRVSGLGFDAWDRDSQLNMLDLAKSAVTDEGLGAIARLTNLRDLQLWQTRIGDAGLSKLSALRELASLDLSETKITDSAVESLKSLKSLRSLNLTKCRLSKSTVDRLRATLQNCDVWYDPPPSDTMDNDDDESKTIEEDN